MANIVKAYAKRAGFDASAFSGHSLRSGFLTSAAAKGASIFKMMDVSRHKSVDTLRGYVRDAELFKGHALTGCFESAWHVVRLMISSWSSRKSEIASSSGSRTSPCCINSKSAKLTCR